MDESKFLNRIRQILWEEWDPIGVNRMGGPDDEYYDYVGTFYAMLICGATEQELIQQLQDFQQNAMGLSYVDPDRDTHVAQLLLQAAVN